MYYLTNDIKNFFGIKISTDMSAVANTVITKGLHTHGTTEKRRLIN